MLKAVLSECDMGLRVTPATTICGGTATLMVCLDNELGLSRLCLFNCWCLPAFSAFVSFASTTGMRYVFPLCLITSGWGVACGTWAPSFLLEFLLSTEVAGIAAHSAGSPEPRLTLVGRFGGSFGATLSSDFSVHLFFLRKMSPSDFLRS